MLAQQSITGMRDRSENRPAVPRLAHPGSESSAEELRRQEAIDRRKRAKQWIAQARGQNASSSLGDGAREVADGLSRNAMPEPAVESKSQELKSSPDSSAFRLSPCRLAASRLGRCGGKL